MSDIAKRFNMKVSKLNEDAEQIMSLVAKDSKKNATKKFDYSKYYSKDAGAFDYSQYYNSSRNGSLANKTNEKFDYSKYYNGTASGYAANYTNYYNASNGNNSNTDANTVNASNTNSTHQKKAPLSLRQRMDLKLNSISIEESKILFFNKIR
jgi:hypothetical protein